jgi:hypothetical protein
MAVTLSIPKIVGAAPVNSQQLHVAKHGSDVNGDGSFNNPFATCTKALSVITDASTTKPYTILLGPGIYTEATLSLKTNVYIVGCGGRDSLNCRINVTAGNVTADINDIVGGRYGISNIYFSASVGLNIDLSTGGSGNTIFILDNVQFNGAVSYKGRSQGDGISLFNCTLLGGLTLVGMTSVGVYQTTVIGNTTFQDSATSAIKAQCEGVHFINVFVTTSHSEGPSPLSSWVNFFGGSYISTITINQGAGTGVYSIIESGSWPFTSLTTVGGPTIYKSSYLHSLDTSPNPIASSDIDWQTATVFTKTLSADTTFTFSNVTDGQEIVVYVTNTASNFTVTWPTVKWSGGTPPTQTVGAKTDIYTFRKVGADIFGTVVQDFS